MDTRIRNHNREVIYSAESRAMEMKTFPSKLEEMMQKFLSIHGIDFECQKIFYIKDTNGWIIRYYIADFYIPGKNIIIEVDGKFHDKHKQHDRMRTMLIQDNYPGIEVLRYKWKDMSNKRKLDDLLYRLV